jgi:hypothetical protein
VKRSRFAQLLSGWNPTRGNICHSIISCQDIGFSLFLGDY